MSDGSSRFRKQIPGPMNPQRSTLNKASGEIFCSRPGNHQTNTHRFQGREERSTARSEKTRTSSSEAPETDYTVTLAYCDYNVNGQFAAKHDDGFFSGCGPSSLKHSSRAAPRDVGLFYFSAGTFIVATGGPIMIDCGGRGVSSSSLPGLL